MTDPINTSETPRLKKSVRQFLFPHWTAWAALTIVMAIIGVRTLKAPTVVVEASELREVWPASTFRTGNLIVDNSTLTATLTVATGTGQSALFSTPRAASTDGFNLCAGGGCQSVAFNTTSNTGSTNTAFGIGSMTNITTGNGNTAMGTSSLPVGTVGQLNTAIGANALLHNTTGSYNTSIGQSSMAAMVDDVDNTALGQATMLNIAHGDGNVSVGVQALEGGVASQTITHSVAIGLNAAQTVLTGAGQITAVGYQSLGAITTAVAPTALGAFSLAACTTCTASTGIGASSGANLTTGQYNTLIGGLAGGGITTGSFNTIIGAQVGGLAAGLSSTVIIADGNGNQRIVVDSTGQTILPNGKGLQVQTFSGTTGTAMLRSFAGDPNGTVTGGEGSIVMDTTTPGIWINTNGATAWSRIVSGSTSVQSVYYGDGTDGTCAFDGVTTPVCGGTLSGSTYTLQRDIAANNMTVSSGVTVRVDNWRVFVFNTLTGGGGGATITAAGFNAAARIPGNGGSNNTRFYPGCTGTGGAGANGTGTGNASGANGVAIPQWPPQASAAAGTSGGGHGQGGGGGSAPSNAGGTGGSIANPSVNSGYFTAVGGFAGKPDGQGASWSLCGTGGGGGGTDGGSSTGGGGGGGGGMLYVGANQCVGTIILSAAGGNGATGTFVDGTGLGGGGGGGGGITTFIYSHRSATCTTTVAGGTGAAGVGTGAAGGNGSSGTAQLYNLSGDGT